MIPGLSNTDTILPAQKKANDEKEVLQNIASQSVKPEHIYGTDEDQGVDPNVAVFDLSSNPLAFAGKQLDFYKDIFKKITDKLPSKNGTHGEVLDAFAGTVNYYIKALGVPLCYIGGEYFHRENIGDAAKAPPLEPVEKEKQLEALKMLDKYLFSPDTFSFPPELLNKLAPDR